MHNFIYTNSLKSTRVPRASPRRRTICHQPPSPGSRPCTLRFGQLSFVRVDYPGLLMSLVLFVDMLELKITSALALTDPIHNYTSWSHVRVLALRDCTFSTPTPAWLFLSVCTLAVSAGGLPYGSSKAPAVDADKELDSDTEAWPVLAMLRCDVHGRTSTCARPCSAHRLTARFSSLRPR